MEKPNKKQEVKYNPKYFIEDLINITSVFHKKIEIMDEIEFSDMQKTLLAGIMMGFTSSLVEINKRLQKWGFLPKENK